MWLNYTEARPHHTVSGALRLLPDLYSPQLQNRRDVLVYLPAGHGQSDQRYPVIYMHDGQNLFDAHTSFAGEWRVDETLQELERDGLAAIVVGLPNMGTQRMTEYSPFVDERRGGGRGDAYLDFLVQTVKPRIDADFMTQAGRHHTALMGSSMGGLISLYGFFRYPEVFGLVGVMSPSLWFAQRAIFPYVETAPYNPGRIYMDMGTAEGGRSTRWRFLTPLVKGRTCADTRRMKQLLARKGYTGNRLRYIEEQDAEHNEAAWARRLPDALRFLLQV